MLNTSHHPQQGFTLIEVLVVASITVFITGLLVINFSRTRVDLNQTVLTIQDAIREAQAQALAGSLVRGTYRCGYGIHFAATGYTLYAGPESAAVDCTGAPRVFDAAASTVLRQVVLASNVLEIVPPLPDIYFEPPNPTTYLNGVSNPGASTTVVVRRKGAHCPSPDCRTVSVSSSGRIQLQ
ncbi:MAG: prepilin-type N-terminal cleavage/methylation domain-containing protein [Candidatus Yanofskybacteria bacterium]|nr:prepilin-type N-terminal cleavage/methylation domain-containing protein [Candidatus Yanofskybacteria bacterium]